MMFYSQQEEDEMQKMLDITYYTAQRYDIEFDQERAKHRP